MIAKTNKEFQSSTVYPSIVSIIRILIQSYDNFNKDIYVLSTGDLDNLDLEDEKYRHGNDWHPTEKVWQDLVPLLVEKLKTQKCL